MSGTYEEETVTRPGLELLAIFLNAPQAALDRVAERYDIARDPGRPYPARGRLTGTDGSELFAVELKVGPDQWGRVMTCGGFGGRR